MGPPIASPAAAPANFPQIDIANPPNKYRLEHKDFYRVPHADNRLAGARFGPPQDLDGTGPESRKLARIESFGSSISSPAASRRSTWSERAKVHANSQRVISPVMTLPTRTKVWPSSNRSAPATMKASMIMPKPPATTIAALIEVMKMAMGWSPPWRGRGLASVSMGDLIAEGTTADKGGRHTPSPARGRVGVGVEWSHALKLCPPPGQRCCPTSPFQGEGSQDRATSRRTLREAPTISTPL